MQNPLMDETREMNIVKVSFLVGKFWKKIPVADSFVFYPKDRTGSVSHAKQGAATGQ